MINSDVTEVTSCCTLPDFFSFNSATTKQTIKSYSSLSKLPVICWIRTLRLNNSLRYKSQNIYYVYVIENFKSVLYQGSPNKSFHILAQNLEQEIFPNRLPFHNKTKRKKRLASNGKINIILEKLKAATKIMWQNSRLALVSSENQ